MALLKSRLIPWHIFFLGLLLGIWLLSLYGSANSQGLGLSLLALLFLPLSLGLSFLHTKRFRLFAFTTFSIFYLRYLPYGLDNPTLILFQPLTLGLVFLVFGSSYILFFAYFGKTLKYRQQTKLEDQKHILKKEIAQKTCSSVPKQLS